MLAVIADLATKLVLALLPEIIEAVRSSKDEAEIRRKLTIKLKRRAIEQAYEVAAAELKKR